MAMNEYQIKQEMKAHIDKEGGPCRTWYVGITSDVERRLFQEHGVPRENAWYCYRTASSAAIARRVEQYFLRLGLDGGGGGGDYNSKTVYAYKKTRHTNP